MIDLSDNDLLNYAIENGMINLEIIHEKIEMQKRREYLEKHTNKIWIGSDKKWRTYLPTDSGGRKLIKRGTEKEIEDIVVDFWKEKCENISLKELFEEYNDSRLQTGQISKSSHMRYLQDFLRYYEPWENKKVNSISPDELCDFIELRVSELNLTNKAFSGFKMITRGIFKRAYRKKLINFRIEEEVLEVIDLSEKKMKKVIKDESSQVFSEKEYDIYVKYLSENCDLWNIALLLILITGIRGGEVVSLKREDIVKEKDYFYITISSTETRYKGTDDKYVYEVKESPKTEAGYRKVIVPKQYNWVCNTLLIRTMPGNYIFVNTNTQKRLTTNSLRRRQERNCKKLNFAQKSPHKGRKTYGSILLDNNIDNNLVIKQMGHVDISTTENFYHRDMKDAEHKAEIISSIPIFGTKMC